MPNYKKLYTTLFNAQTDAIRILQDAQQKAEAIYIDSPDPKEIFFPDDIGEPLPSEADGLPKE